jgi:hypothetical protein
MANTVTRDVALNIIGQIRDYQAKVGEIPGVTEKAAASAALKMQAVFVKAARDRLKTEQDTASKVVKINTEAADKVGNSFSANFAKAARSISQNQLISQTETVGALFIQLGGTVSRVASIFTSIVRPAAIMNEVLGAGGATIAALGGAAVVATIAVAGIAYEVLGLGASAVAAKEELEKFNVEMSPDKAAQIDSYAVGAKRLAIAIDEIHVAAGAGVAEDLGAIKTALADGVSMLLTGTDRAQAFLDTLIGLGQTVSQVAGEIVGFNRGADVFNKVLFDMKAAANPIPTLLDSMLSSFKGENTQLAKNEQVHKQYVETMGAMDTATKLANDQLKEQIQRLKEQAQRGQDASSQLHADIEAQQELARAIGQIDEALRKGETEWEKYQKLREAVTADTLLDEEKIQQKTEDRFRTVDELQAEGVITAEEAAATRAAIERALQEELTHIRVQANDEEMHERTQVLAAQSAAAKQIRATELQLAEDVASAWMQTLQQISDQVAQTEAQWVSDDNQAIDSMKSNQKDLLQKIKDTDKKIGEDQSKYYDDRMDQEQELKDKIDKTTDETTRQQLIAQEIVLNNKIAAAKRQEEQDAKQARASAVRSRTISLFSVGLSTAEAIAKAIAEWGPPPSPLGILGIAAAASIGAAQAAAIIATPLPTFYQGTSAVPGGPGEVSATLHGGEAVLNARAARDLGPAIIDALNAGLSPLSALQGASGGGDIYLDGMRVGRVMAKQARGSGAFGHAVRSGPVGFVNPYGRY